MINGFDVSHWQGARGVATCVKKVPNAKFVIIKATEGAHSVDTSFEQNAVDAVACGLMTGFYHYARPEYNTPKAEAKHFVDTVKKHIGTSVLVLDYEGKALEYGYTWALDWLREVYRLTGVRPLIYLSGSKVKDYTAIATEDFGLWIAAWSSESKMKSYLKGWNFWAMWQYSTSGGALDLDKFNGTEGQFLMYAAIDEEWLKQQKQVRCGCDCECCGGCNGN